MQQIDSILKEIVIEILVDMKHEVQTDFPGIHHLLGGYIHSFDVSVVMVCFHNHGSVESWDKKVEVA
jgi:hypothetical protein